MPGKEPACEEPEPSRRAWLGWHSCVQARVRQPRRHRNRHPSLPVPSSLSLDMCRHAASKRALQELITANLRVSISVTPQVRLHRGVFIIGMSLIKARAS